MALKKGDFVGAVDSLGHALKLRVARYGELAPACASTYYRYGRALLYKAQKATRHLENVPEKGTISNADTKEGHNPNGKDQDRNDGNDKEMAGDGDDSDVELARKMLDIAGVITKNRTDNTVDSLDTSKILSALTEVSMEKRKRGIRNVDQRGNDPSLSYTLLGRMRLSRELPLRMITRLVRPSSELPLRRGIRQLSW